MKRISSLRTRWMINTIGVLFALGMVCVMGITALFAGYHFSQLESDLKSRAAATTAYFENYLDQDREYDAFYHACEAFAAGFDAQSDLQLQFVENEGQLIASSHGMAVGTAIVTPEIPEAVSTRAARSYTGKNPGTGEQIMAVSFPMIYSNGEVVGVLRYVTSTRTVRQEVWWIFTVSLAVLIVMLVVAGVTSGYYLRSIFAPLEQITEKAKRIATGSYGIQIQTKYKDEIGELAETINEMSAKIAQNEKIQAEFISQLSHELRTPLTVINGWSETLLSDEGMDPMTRQGMKIISGEAQRLTEMVMELLDFTRMQDGRMTLTVELSDIRGEFEDTVFMYASRLTQDGIKLHYEDNDDDIPEIPCDPKRLRQVFLNILDNAAKHGGEGKRVDVSMRFEDGCVVVRFRDYGPGIPEDEIPLVKKKFYKGSSKARGTGIGLAVCDEIVEMHGGTLTLENAPGGGTLVTVSLPSAQ